MSYPEFTVGFCCGCKTFNVTLYHVPGREFRYRCGACFLSEARGVATPEDEIKPRDGDSADDAAWANQEED